MAKSNDSATLALCASVLTASEAAKVTGASTMQIAPGSVVFVEGVPRAVPTASCNYNVVGGADEIPDLHKSLMLSVWTNQSDASGVFEEFLNTGFNPYQVPSNAPVKVQGIGKKAFGSGPEATGGQQLLVQVNSKDVFFLIAPDGVPITTLARNVIDGLNGAASGG
jgi:hypothetical protein